MEPATVTPSVEPVAAIDPRPRTWLPMLLVTLIVVAYTTFYTAAIVRNKSLPYWDQTHYISKTHDLAERLRSLPSWTDYFRPDTYLSVPPRQRPPLLMILPAAVFGPNAGPHKIAVCFLIQRMAALIAAVWIIGRVLGDFRWGPLAMATILGGGYFLTVEPHLYIMDHAAASFALLLFAAAVWEIKAHSVASAWGVLVASLLVTLTKPIGFALVAVVVGALAVERIIHETREFLREPGKRRRQVTHALLCLIPYVLLGLSLLYLRGSAYGQEVREQYKLGMKGYWTFEMTPERAARLFTGIVPLWLVFAAVVALAWGKGIRQHRALLLFAVALLVAWTLINLSTYAVDERSYWVIMPALCTAAAIVICLSDLTRRVATVLGGAVFTCGMLAAFGVIEETPLPRLAFGTPAAYEEPAPEVGLRPLARSLTDQFLRVANPPTYVPVFCTFNTNYAEPAALRLAARYENQNKWSPIVFGEPTFGSQGFTLDPFTTFEWFLSKNGAAEERLRLDAWANRRAYEALLTDPASPLRGCFETVRTFPIVEWFPLYVRQSEGRKNGPVDTAILWRRARMPTIAELQAAAHWIEPRFRNMPGQAEVRRMVARYDELAARGNMLATIAQEQLAAATAAGDAAYRDLDFGGVFVLRAAVYRKDRRKLELYWEARVDQPLDRLRFVHVMAEGGKVLGQLDAPMDATPGGAVKAGTTWRDVLDLHESRFDRAATVAIGLVRGKETPLKITPAVHTDWDGHRLLISLPK